MPEVPERITRTAMEEAPGKKSPSYRTEETSQPPRHSYTNTNRYRHGSGNGNNYRYNGSNYSHRYRSYYPQSNYRRGPPNRSAEPRGPEKTPESKETPKEPLPTSTHSESDAVAAENSPKTAPTEVKEPRDEPPVSVAPAMVVPPSVAWQQQIMAWTAYQQHLFAQMNVQRQLQGQQQQFQHFQQHPRALPGPLQPNGINESKPKHDSDGGTAESGPPALQGQDEVALARQLDDMLKENNVSISMNQNGNASTSGSISGKSESMHSGVNFGGGNHLNGGDKGLSLSSKPMPDAQNSTALEYHGPLLFSDHSQQRHPWMKEASDLHKQSESTRFSPHTDLGEQHEKELIPQLLEPQLKTRRQVALEVGGRIFYVFPSTFQAYPESRLNCVLNGSIPVELNDRNAIAFDRDGVLFDYLLAFCRTGRLTIPPGVRLAALYDEAEYFGLLSYIKDRNRPGPDRYCCLFRRERRRRLYAQSSAAGSSDANLTCLFIVRDEDQLILKEIVRLNGGHFALLLDVFKETDGSEVQSNFPVYDSRSPSLFRSQAFSSGYIYRFKLHSLPDNPQVSSSSFAVAEVVFEEEYTFTDSGQIGVSLEKKT